jgi:hypothetical protein
LQSRQHCYHSLAIQEGSSILAEVHAKNKMERFKEAVINRIPKALKSKPLAKGFDADTEPLKESWSFSVSKLALKFSTLGESGLLKDFEYPRVAALY